MRRLSVRATASRFGTASPAYKHGHSLRRGRRTPTYNSWRGARQRCLLPSLHNYDDYGGRGIKICERWLTFSNFLADMGERPAFKTLERRDVNGNYDPDNCCWATPGEQRANRRDTDKEAEDMPTYANVVNALLDDLEDDWDALEEEIPELRICLACGMPGERRINDAGESFCKHCGGRDHMPPLPAILAVAGRAPFQGAL